MSGARSSQLNKVSVSTLCTSKAEFISRFGPFLDETTIFFTSRLPLVIGQPVAFAICLKDRQPMLEGDGKIIEVQPLPGRSTRSGLRIKVRAYTAKSLPMKEAILAARGARRSGPASRPSPPAPPPVALAPTQVAPAPPPVAPARPVHPPASPPSVVVKEARPLPRAPGTTANVLPLVPPGERRQGAPDTLPANPFADVSASALSFYIESNLAESDETHQAGEDADLDSPAIHRNLLVRVLSWRAPPTLPPAVRIAVPMAASSLLTLVACWAIWGRAPHPPEIAGRGIVPPAAPSPPRAAAPVPAPVPPPAAPEMAPAAAAVSAAPLAPSPAPSGCLVRIASRPAGATVTMGKRRLGKTPLQAAAVPCGKQVLTVSHARYSSVQEVVAATPGTAASSFVRLPRPPAQLTLTSMPAGAAFKVNRTQLGRSPGSANVLRFERVRIEARLPGYRPWRQTMYVAAATTRVNATLVPLASRSHRRR